MNVKSYSTQKSNTKFKMFEPNFLKNSKIKNMLRADIDIQGF